MPVSDLESTRRFYVDVLGAIVGRVTDDWIDVLLWGHQITLQRRPEEVIPLERRGKWHFGVVFPWTAWRDEMARLERRGATFLESPSVKLAGTEDEHAKAYLVDPSENLIELKAYKNVEKTLRLPEEGAGAPRTRL